MGRPLGRLRRRLVGELLPRHARPARRTRTAPPVVGDATARRRRPAARRSQRADTELGRPDPAHRPAVAGRQGALPRLHGTPVRHPAGRPADRSRSRPEDGTRGTRRCGGAAATASCGPTSKGRSSPASRTCRGARAVVAASAVDRHVLSRRRRDGRAVAAPRRPARVPHRRRSRTCRAPPTAASSSTPTERGTLRRRRARRPCSTRRAAGGRAIARLAGRRSLRATRPPVRRSQGRRTRRAAASTCSRTSSSPPSSSAQAGSGPWGQVPDDWAWALVCAPGVSSGAARRCRPRRGQERLWAGADRSIPGCSDSTTADVVQLIRWRHAVPTCARATTPGWPASRQRPPIVFAGDWLVQPCVEGAVRSGIAAAEAIGASA